MIRYLMLGSLLLAAPALAQEAVTLKPGAGLDAVTASCATCHTLGYIRMNSPFLTEAGWKAEVDKMRGAYGAPIDDDAANAIIQYLTRAYGAPKS